MDGETENLTARPAGVPDTVAVPQVVDRATFQAELDGLRVREKAHTFLHSRDATYATLCQGPFEESVRYRDFMGWDMPWYSAVGSLDTLLSGRRIGRMHLVCYLRQGDRVVETHWTTVRGVEAMDHSNALPDLTVYRRQEAWEDSPAGWPQRSEITGEQHAYQTGGRPIAQWSRLQAGRSDELAARADF
jgi:predicted dithiol-disulfide oxidoreductase (DUF899 family)